MELKWEDVQGLDRLDIITYLKEMAEDNEVAAGSGVRGLSESYSLQYHAAAIKAAIRKLKETDDQTR